ncbi:MAG: sodium:solute symporter [Clostridiales Family XIII bacterium]|jgi:SSS family solute:Na+ symporter/sodium/proline symporter|nr:sodium:solute symporter [Clostridiales Family XIII bacterium]
MTQVIAVIAIVVFTFVCVVVGALSSKQTGSVEGFFLAGRNVGPWLSAFSYGTSYFSAVIFIGYAGMFGWIVGMGSILIGVGNAVLGCLIAWVVLAKPTRRMTHKLEARTMPEFFAARYLGPRMKIYAALIIFIFLVPYAAGVYKGLGTLFSAIFVGASPQMCMIIVAILTGIYLVLGGYVATAWNDLIQGIIMFVGITAMVVILLNRPEVGGIGAMIDNLKSIDPSLVDLAGGAMKKTLYINILLTSFGVWGMPQMIHKYYAIKDESSIRKATVVSTIFAVFIGCGAYFVGSMGRLFIDAGADGLPAVEGGYDNVVPTILMKALSGGTFSVVVLCIIMLLLLSASMSTLSALVLSSSSAVTIDLIRSVRKDLSQKAQVVTLRVFCVVFIALSFVFATMNISFIVNLMSFSWGVVAGSFIGPFIWGLYGKFITKAGAWAGLLAGPVVVGLMLTINIAGSGFAAAKSMAPVFGVTAMAVSVVIVPVVSLLTKKFAYSKDHLDNAFGKIEEAPLADRN